MILVLDNIRSTHNVGAIFRTAEGAGVSEIILVGITPSPIDRFGRERSDVAKAAVGAQLLVSWKYFESSSEAIEYLHERVDTIIALEQTAQAVDYKSLAPLEDASHSALVVGNEIDGVSDELLQAAHHHCEIPMQGEKESLNVSTACGIALFRLLDI
jgi:tRNA G18 (ribose-2'-O)-methylase SpoU